MFGWPQVRVALSCLREATAGGHYSRFAHHAIDTAQAYRPEESRLRFAPTKIVLARTLGGTGGSDGRLKSRPTFANSLDCGPSLSLATTDGELFLPPTVPSTPRAIPIVRSPQGNSILLQLGTAGAYLGLPPPTRQHSSGDCLNRLAACALLAINRRVTNHRPHRRGGGVEAEVDRVAFDTSFHHGFSTG